MYHAVEVPSPATLLSKAVKLSMLLLLLLDDLLAGNSNSGPGSWFRNCGKQPPHCKVAVVYTLDFPSSTHVIALVNLPAFPGSLLVMFENSNS